MPRPRKPELEGKEVKKRSRNGCWPCKSRKVKCGEEKPACINCQRQGEECDYSIRLNWDGRTKKKDDGRPGSQILSFDPPSASPSAPALGRSNSAQSAASGIQVLRPGPPSHHGSSPLPLSARPILQESALPPAVNLGNGLPLPAMESQPHLLPTPPILRNPNWGEGHTHVPFAGPMPSLRQSMSMPAYPSPSDSSFSSPGLMTGMYTANGYSAQMPPPMPTSIPYTFSESIGSPYNPAKRVRLSPQHDAFNNINNPSLLQRAGSYGPEVESGTRVQFNPATPTFFPAYAHNPLTPAPSFSNAGDAEDRRISVSSLLSEDVEPRGSGSSSKRPSASDGPSSSDQYPDQIKEETEEQVKVEDFANSYQYTEAFPGKFQPPERPPDPNREEPIRRGSLHQRMISYSATETYGHDRGQPDYDLHRNNDAAAISSVTPSEQYDFSSWLDEKYEDPSFGFGTASREQVFAPGGYYATPVPIKIPRKLEPLPQSLVENPMNLLYFHHFLNHTARILVPHDCPENPFKTILPKMAVGNPNLLNLMLAYSACHRARLLGHPEPANRIAVWVRDVFPDLRHTLDNVSNTSVSNSNLATAVMLASLEIISPSSFGVSIPWQNHLSIARSIIRSRAGPHSISRKDPVMYFLTRWMAYLDVLGSLSGRRNEEPLFAGDYWSSSHDADTSTKELLLDDDEVDDDEDDYTIDCMLGFTTRCVSILAQVAVLARECEPHRIDAETGQINTDWRPSADIEQRALNLRKELEAARNHESHQCLHHSPHLGKTELAGHDHPPQPERRYSYVHMTDKDAEESLATNSAFHWAGLIHLLRRIHNLPRADPDVQHAVHEIVKIISTLREGGSAEACLLFPMFTAGVEADDALDRAEVLAKIKGVEGLGMCQVSRARKIMEEAWRTGESWEVFVTGEFFG